MKWLLLTLLSINLVLFIVYFKAQKQPEEVFQKAPGAGDIQLLSEVARDSDAAVERCYVLSGFPSDEMLVAAKKYLKASGIKFRQVSKQKDLASVFWVYVRPDGNADQVRDVLSAQGVDTYEINDGELTGSLSAGLFENIDLARAMVARLKEAGLTADFAERKKKQALVSLEINNAEVKHKAVLIQGFTEQKIKMDEIKEFFCKGIASEK